MTLSEKIYRCRRKRGLSQEALAAQLNVSRQAVSKWETGDAEPETGKLIGLAQTFGVTVDWLLNKEDSTLEETDSILCPEPKLDMGHRGLRNLRLGYGIYLGCLALFSWLAINTQVYVWPKCSLRIDFSRLANFFDPITLSAMVIGCILLLYGSKLLHPAAGAFQFMFLKQACENPSKAQIMLRCRAVSAALVGWILGGVLYAVIFIVNSFRGMELPVNSVSMTGAIVSTLLNLLFYTVLALFILLPIQFSLRQKLL